MPNLTAFKSEILSQRVSVRRNNLSMVSSNDSNKIMQSTEQDQIRDKYIISPAIQKLKQIYKR